MTVVPFPRHRTSSGHGQPATPAFGRVDRVGWRGVALRLAPLVALLAVALLVRASGVLRPPQPALPPLPGTAAVAPGLLRGGPPQEVDLTHLRDDYRVHAVVGVDGMSVDEQAVATGLGVRTLTLHVDAASTPSVADIRALAAFLRDTGPAHAVYLHDSTGHGPVVVVAAVLRLLRGVPLATVQADLSHDEIAHLSVNQLLVLRDVDAVVHGRAPADPRYAALSGVTW